MNILIPLKCFGRAGGYKTLAHLSSFWKNMGHTVDFVTPINDPPYYPTDANIILIDYEGKQCNTQCKKCERNTFIRMNAIIRYVRKNRQKYDVVLASQNTTALLCWLGRGKNLFYYVQAYEPDFYSNGNFRDRLNRSIARLTYQLPYIRIVNAEIYKNYKNLYSKYVIPPGIDLDTYYPKTSRWDKKRPFIVGCIGRKEEWKGSNDVARAVSILQSEHVKIEFIVAFNSVNNADYKLVHPDGDEKLSAYYRNLDVLVAPATLQLGAIHYPVIEAMASHTIVVTTGYYPADNSNSYIVPIHSPQKIAETIKYIMSHYDEAVMKSDNALRDIQRFDWNYVSTEFIKIFQENI